MGIAEGIQVSDELQKPERLMKLQHPLRADRDRMEVYYIDNIGSETETEKEIESWCRELWYKKDQLLDQFSQEKKFPNKYDHPFKVNFLQLNEFIKSNQNKKNKSER